MIRFAVLLLTLPFCGNLVADEEADQPEVQVDEQRIEIRVNRSSTQSDDEEPEAKVKGVIVIDGSNGRQEFRLGDELPEGFPLQLKALSGANGLIQLHATDAEDAKPRYMIGLRCTKVLPDVAKDKEIPDGAVVAADVFDDMPAAKAGMQAGDVLLKIDDKEVQGVESLVDLISASEGRAVRIALLRDDEQKDLEVLPKLVAPKELKAQIGADGEMSEQIDKLFQQQGNGRWVFGPGIQLGNGRVDINQIIQQAMKSAQQADSVRNETDKQEPETERALRRQIRRLQKQVDDLTERIEKLEK